ncbi:MAG: exodeoxyribonuclease VII large subunit [Planctomycetota bacterium]|jgi:exodeoxyribonuclease VII large subunit
MQDPSRPFADSGASTPQIYRVSELNDYLKGVLSGLGRIAVEGEVASLARPASGHMYFALKDRRRGVESVINCAIWRSQAQRALKEPLKEGDKVIAHGKLDIYAPRGSYSLIIDRVEAVGLGAMLAQLEELKRELRGLGWFDRSRKLPTMPKIVGVVTSRDGAAFQDFLRTRSLRWPLYPVRFVHTPVQGPGAAKEIAAAISDLDRTGVDALVVCRGGGSLEDLWAFNERPVAEAIWNCSVPVICGVGHETDVTLADHVADHRAHTPTDAAQMVIPARREYEERLERQGSYLLEAIDSLLVDREERLDRLQRARSLSSADWILDNRFLQVSKLGERLTRAATNNLQRVAGSVQSAQLALTIHAPARRLEREAARLDALGQRLQRPVREGLSTIEAKLELVQGRLEAFSPYAVLGRGYSITRPAAGGAPITSSKDLSAGTRLETRLADGTFTSVVEGEPK